MSDSSLDQSNGCASAVDASDLSIVLSVAVDSEDRVENLRLLLEFFDAACRGALLIVVEQADEPVLGHLCDRPGVIHHPLHDGGVHWKTRNLNRGAAISTREFLLFVDCDVAPTVDAIATGLARLRAGSSFVQLYDGVSVNVDRRILAQRPDWLSILSDAPHFDRLHRPDHRPALIDMFSPLYGNAEYLATGGCTACRRVDHIVVGGWNENFVSYGFEDQEYFERLEKLGWRVERIANHNAYHLDHARGNDSYYNDYRALNESEYDRVAAMSRRDLETYVMNGFRRVVYRPGVRFARVETQTESRLYAIEEDREDLRGREVNVLVDAASPSTGESGMADVLDHLASHYRNYRVRLFETGGVRYRDLGNGSNVVYRRLPPDDAERIREAGAVYPLRADSSANLETLRTALAHDASSGDVSNVALPEPGSNCLPAVADWNPSAHAIYLCFDDHFAEFARACINSIRLNFPDHPPLLVDYVGDDAGVLDYLRNVNARRLPPVESLDFDDRIGTGPVGRDIVFNRFRLWSPEFDTFDVILHLDADTLVLGELTALFTSNAFRIARNHEQTKNVRVFDPIFELDPVLNDRLREDGLSYPAGPDDMANAGVYALPKALRSAEERRALDYLAERYGAYFAFADQSLISLWCHYRGLRFDEDVRYNYQSPFLTDASIDTELSTVRVFHFSSHRKPGSEVFRQWDRIAPHAAMLEDAFNYYLALE